MQIEAKYRETLGATYSRSQVTSPLEPESKYKPFGVICFRILTDKDMFGTVLVQTAKNRPFCVTYFPLRVRENSFVADILFVS